MRVPYFLLGLLFTGAVWAADDDLFTGVPKDDFDRRAEKFPVQKWEAIVRGSSARPLEIPPDTPTNSQVQESLEAWFKAEVIKPGLAEIAGDPQEERLRELIEAGVGNFVGRPTDLRMFVPDADAVANGEKRRPIVDFFAACVQGTLKDQALAMKLHGEAASRDGLPRVLRMISSGRAYQLVSRMDRGNLAKAERAYLDSFEQFAGAKIDEAEAPQIVQLIQMEALPVLWSTRDRWHLERIAKAPWPEWMRLTLAGEVEANVVSLFKVYNEAKRKEKGIGELETYVARARKDFTEAWKANPKQPWAAAMMIRLAAYDKDAPAMRLWMDRALAANLDNPLAYTNFFDCARPDRGGSFEDMLGFGYACAQTGRFETNLPTQFNGAVFEIASNTTDWQSLYRHPDLARLLIDTRRRRLEKARGTFEEMSHESALVLELWLVGDTAAAAKTAKHFEKDGGYLTPASFRTVAAALGEDHLAILSELTIANSAVAADWQRAKELRAAKKFTEAAAVLKEALPKTNQEAEGPAIETELVLAEFPTAYEKGNWMSLTTGRRWAWKLINTAYRTAPNGFLLALNGTAAGNAFFRGALGTRFEVRGKVCLPPGAPAGVSFVMGHAARGVGLRAAHWLTVRLDRRNANEYIAGYVWDWEPYALEDKNAGPMKKRMEFVLHREDAKFTFSIDGKTLIQGLLPENLGGDVESFGIGTTGGVAEFYDLEARKLK